MDQHWPRISLELSPISSSFRTIDTIVRQGSPPQGMLPLKICTALRPAKDLERTLGLATAAVLNSLRYGVTTAHGAREHVPGGVLDLEYLAASACIRANDCRAEHPGLATDLQDQSSREDLCKLLMADSALGVHACRQKSPYSHRVVDFAL